ncbi:MAG: antitoxin family protein [bacterium]|nr:antitoxin family protein [bacterium]MDW8321860.1 antitoxin family protein [Armatimonadota bacterium]
MASRVIEAEYDGKVLIPKEPLDLPVGARLQLSIHVQQDVEERLQRLRALWRYFEDNPVDAPSLDDEALRRENLYGDRL